MYICIGFRKGSKHRLTTFKILHMKKLLLAAAGMLAGISAWAAETVLWEGSQDLDWNGEPYIEASKCANFEAGGAIVNYYEIPNASEYTALGMTTGNWSGDFAGKWGATDAVPGGSTMKTSDPMSQEVVDKMKSVGFRYMGHNVKLTKVAYKAPDGAYDPTQLLSDPVTITNESGSVNFSYDKIVAAGGVVGGGIQVNYTGEAGKNFYIDFLHQGDADNQYTWCRFSAATLIETDGQSILVLSQSVMDELNTYSKTLIVQGGFVAISSVKVVKPADMPEIKDEVTLDQATATIVKGDELQLTAKVKPADATLTWSSSDEAVATVDATGKVTAIAAGTATITATTGNATATCVVTVLNEAVSIKLTRKNLDFKLGDSYVTIQALTTPEGEEVVFEFEMDPDGCFTHNDNVPGKNYMYYQTTVSPKKVGTGKVIAYLKKYPTVRAECPITVTDFTENTIVYEDGDGAFDNNFDALVVGMKNLIIYPMVKKPGGKDDYNYMFESAVAENKDIADVTESLADYGYFIIDLLKPGTANFKVVMAKSDTDKIEGTLTIDVKAYGDFTTRFDYYNGDPAAEYNLPADGVLTDFTAIGDNVEMTISSGDCANKAYTINEGATLTFKTTDPNVRIISIKPSVHGNYRGSVSFYDKATCSTGAIGTEMPRYNLWEPDAADKTTGVESVTFTTTAQVKDLVIWTVVLRRYLPAEVAISEAEVELGKEQTKQLTAEVTPTEGIMPGKLVWTSSDEEVATVNAKGLVTAGTKFGTAIITAEYNGVKAECKVDVTEAAGVADIAVETEAPVEYYNLQGVRMAAEQLAPGIYIRRQGNKATKVMVR